MSWAVNFHITRRCDSHCGFCFGTYRDAPRELRVDDGKRVIVMLREYVFEKITFAGGEPTLHPGLGEYIEQAKAVGMTTSVVTNGFRLDRILDRWGGMIDWVGFSVDSSSESVQKELGRGRGDQIARVVCLVDRCREIGVRIKLNTVVTSATWQEDMTGLVEKIRPERWKIMQVLRVMGENDGSVEPYLVTAEQFRRFVERNMRVEERGVKVVVEPNEAMVDSYAMLDPQGRFYGNSGQVHRVSRPVLEVGVERALESVGFSREKFLKRGGCYQ